MRSGRKIRPAGLFGFKGLMCGAAGGAPMTHRVAVLDREACQPRKCGLECIKYCPVNKSGADCIAIDEETAKARIDEDLCNGCGICVKVCPFDAIRVVNLATEMSSDKVHQYGRNSFRLYRLPAPKRGQVVGLLGRNGMGKSTVVDILAGRIRPNLGRHDDEPGWDEVLAYYSGTEMKAHFEAVRAGGLRTSTKPQRVDRIASAFDGTAADLISKYDERGEGNRLVEELGLDSASGRMVSELSGGELQRVAVAAAAARDAGLYFFDEPSSYNDAYQRAAVARVIRSLAGEGRSVVVVEHDLTLLDYMSDYVEVLYGEPGAYGIVSGMLSTKVGINAFLDGYLPGDNVRFRERAFTLDASASAPGEGADEFASEDSLVEWGALSKSHPGFVLSAGAGRVRRGEVLGVAGANALGKTTMMRVLAGVDEPDSGGVGKKARVSYKPQYLRPGEGRGGEGDEGGDADVESVLSRANGAPVAGSIGEGQIVDHLRVKRLYPRRISALSGGELQKVAVAACLLREADVYALDEPSAFLDVEDRIALARFMKKFVRTAGRAAVVIDHDIQLVDLVSDSIVMFDGEPGRSGAASGPMPRGEAMNAFLRSLDMTFRRDERSSRPRVNKAGSRLDKEQKRAGSYYMQA